MASADSSVDVHEDRHHGKRKSVASRTGGEEELEPLSRWDHLKRSEYWVYLRDTLGLGDETFAMLNLWLIWLFVGTVFYAYELDIGWAKGFYMAVNIGYSIGWGDISEGGQYGSMWFSTVYVLCGASFIAAALGFFAQAIVDDRDNWYTNELQRVEYEAKMRRAARHDDNTAMFMLWAAYNHEKIRSIVLWLLFIAVATGAAASQHREWEFIEALYFAVSSLSTGGHYSLPGDSKDWEYGLTGFFCALGVPLMGIAMATLAEFFMSPGSLDDLMERIREKVTLEEVDMLTEFNLADDNGTIDKAEFLILCMVRIGAADPNLVKKIIAHFSTLDTSGDGELSMEEICEKEVAQRQAVRRASMGVVHESDKAALTMAMADIRLEERRAAAGGSAEEEKAAEPRERAPAPPPARDVGTETDDGLDSGGGCDGAPVPPATPAGRPFVPLAVSSLLRPRHTTPQRVPMRFDLYESDEEEDGLDRSESLASPERAAAATDALDLSAAAADDAAAREAIAKLGDAWELLRSDKYVVQGRAPELGALLEELGVYSAEDLADAGELLMAQRILPLLKPVARNKIVRLLSLDPALAAEAGAEAARAGGLKTPRIAPPP